MSGNHSGLSQEQIDALLNGQAAQAAAVVPEVAPDAAPAVVLPGSERDVQIYDFRRPRRVSRERQRALQAMYDRLVRSFEAWATGRTRGPLEMKLEEVEQLTFQEYQLSLPTLCAAYTFEIADSAGQQGVINFGQEFAFFVVDRLFGGAGLEYPVFERPLTQIERNALKTFAERAVGALREIWQDHVKLDLDISGFESAPEILQAANPDDPMLVASIAVRAASRTSLVTISLPFSVLDKFFASGDQRKATLAAVRENEAARQVAEAGLRVTGVELAVRLPVAFVTMAQLESLHPGDELPLSIRKDALHEVHIEGQHRFSGVGGHWDGYNSVALTEEAVQRGDTRTPTRPQTR